MGRVRKGNKNRPDPTPAEYLTSPKNQHMINLKNFEIWFVTGSQHLYGPDTLEKVSDHSKTMAAHLNASSRIPVTVIWRPTVKTPEEIHLTCAEANASPQCIGIITWMHTFSPAKMWINGLKILQKPILHLHTQFNRDIPWADLDMDFMNLNQSAHGDRELGFMMTRMGLRRKVLVGFWQDDGLLDQINGWARACAGWQDWQGARFVRFGDNMRQVAVTDGDKVEAEYQFGYSVNSHGIGDLVKTISEVTDQQTALLVEEYESSYRMADSLRKEKSQHAALIHAARIELGLKAFLEQGGYKGFTDTFEDLHGMEQLPGIAVQRLMKEGYGFAAEGDWKTAALVRAMKVMASGLPGGNSFMEDYTYHFEPGNQLVLGAHMLEICESIAAGKPSCEIHPLGIGGKGDPVRLVFDVAAGPAINASLLDLGNHFRLLVNEVEAVRPPQPIPRLPVARVLWKPLPDLQTSATAWLLAGGAHHTCFSQNLHAGHLEDFSGIAGIEFVLIGKNTDIYQFRKELRWNEIYYQINK
jgi:L-arabinose isomerase